MNTFWLHRDHIYAQNLSIGFSTFSVGHLIWLLAIGIFCYATGRLYRRSNEKQKDLMRKICGFSIVTLEYAKIIVMGLFQVNTLEFVPLHLCSVAGIAVLVYALWPGKKWLAHLFAYAFFPAALMAVVFPSTTMYPWWNFYCIHTFVFHALIMAFFVWLFMDGQIMLSYRGLWLGLLFIALFAIPIYWLDGVFQVNYMFIGMRSDVSILAALWDSITPTYGRAGFAVVLGVLMTAVIHLFFAVYCVLLKKKRAEKR